MSTPAVWDAWFPTRLRQERENLAAWLPYPVTPEGRPYFPHAVRRWARGGFVSAETGRRDEALLLHYETQALAFVKRNLLTSPRMAMERDFWRTARWMCYIAERGLKPHEAVRAIHACDSTMELHFARDGHREGLSFGAAYAKQHASEEKTATLNFATDRVTKRCTEPNLLFLEYVRLLARTAEVNSKLDAAQAGIQFRCLRREPGDARRPEVIAAAPPARLTEAAPFFVTVGGVRMTLRTFHAGTDHYPDLSMFHDTNTRCVLPLSGAEPAVSNVGEAIQRAEAFVSAATFNQAVLQTLDEYVAPKMLAVQLKALPEEMIGHLLTFVNVLEGWPTPTRAGVLGTQ